MVGLLELASWDEPADHLAFGHDDELVGRLEDIVDVFWLQRESLTTNTYHW